jgi:hypothetical protein
MKKARAGAKRTDRGWVQRTSRRGFTSQGALEQLDTTLHSNMLRLVFDTAALRPVFKKRSRCQENQSNRLQVL